MPWSLRFSPFLLSFTLWVITQRMMRVLEALSRAGEMLQGDCTINNCNAGLKRSMVQEWHYICERFREASYLGMVTTKDSGVEYIWIGSWQGFGKMLVCPAGYLGRLREGVIIHATENARKKSPEERREEKVVAKIMRVGGRGFSKNSGRCSCASLGAALPTLAVAWIKLIAFFPTCKSFHSLLG